MSEKVRVTIDVDIDAVDLSEEVAKEVMGVSVTNTPHYSITDIASNPAENDEKFEAGLRPRAIKYELGNAAYELIPAVMITTVSPIEFEEMISGIVAQGGYYEKNIDVKASYEGFDCWLSDDGSCGFAISPEGELTNVFSTHTGRGQAMMKLATSLYDRLTLNCFDGYTRKFYEYCGFTEHHREENYDGEGRDVVYMSYGFEA